jgi:hypothetical protein
MTEGIFDQWWPVTQDFGLINCPINTAADAYENWLGGSQQLERSIQNVGLAEVFSALAPLTHSKTRRLFIPATAGWTAFFQNGISGSDPFQVMNSLARNLGVLSMRVCCPPEAAKYTAVIWEVYAPVSLGGDEFGHRRSIAASNDGGRWVFQESGKRFPFELIERYGERRKRDRFTREMLVGYLRQFGISSLGDHLFALAPEQPAILFQRIDTIRHPQPEYSLAEVQQGVPWRR